MNVKISEIMERAAASSLDPMGTTSFRLPKIHQKAFQEACERRGVVVSDVLREFVAAVVEHEASP